MKFDPLRQSPGHPPHPLPSGSRAGEGLSSEVGRDFDGTVIYVHGIANKPLASVLKCQWDRALFGTGMGQRTRMVYWVNRDRYPDPYPSTCNERDLSEGVELGDDGDTLQDEERVQRLHLAAQQASRLLERSDATEKDKELWSGVLRDLADRIESNASRVDLHTQAEVLPLPRWARERLTRTFTKLLLNDVHDYFFDPAKAAEIDAIFQSRLSGGPFVVVGHSLGSVIAYRNLCRPGLLEPGQVRLFLTIGSPLGLQEVQDALKRNLGTDELQLPESVCQWVNVADRLDPVALDMRLHDDIDRSIEDIQERNLDSPRHPHSATGYLSIPVCQRRVREVVGSSFVQPISSFSIARDLTDRIEDSLTFSGTEESPLDQGERHHVLIELNEHKNQSLEEARRRLLGEIRESLGDRTFRSLKYIELNRYLAVYLTSLQIEQLGPLLQQKAAGRIWSDAEKLCLVDHSIKRDDPIQSAAASRVYGADGAEIHWAVLDTGVENSHPHFGTYDNIEEMWDCTHQASTLQAPDADPIDHHGHGTHVAAIIAGTPHASSTDASARSGVGPRTKIHSYKVLDDSGRGRDSFIIRALDHIASLNQASTRNVIHGVNLSLGGPFDPETYGCGHSPICRELRRLWRQGVLVVVAAGNAGFAELQSTRGSVRANLDLSIGDPANLEESIAVGSVHLTRPLTYGTSFFSSRGPTADGRQKPDLVAPGERVRSANYAYRYAEDYIELSGTSMAAPHVSGLLAAFLSQRRELIGEPDRVKTLLLSTCTDLQRDRYVQGAGLPNLVRMLLAT